MCSNNSKRRSLSINLFQTVSSVFIGINVLYHVNLTHWCEVKPMSTVKVQESSGRLSVSIPKSVADLKGWKRGTVLEFKEHAGFVCLVEVK